MLLPGRMPNATARFRYSLHVVNRWIYVRLVRITGFVAGIIGVPPVGAVFKAMALVPGLRSLAVPLWRRVLQKGGFRNRASAWMDWVVQRWPTPQYQVLCALALLDARRFEGIPPLLRAAKQSLTKKPRYKGLYFDIVNVEAMLAIENGAVAPESAFFAVGRGSAIADFCYQRAWDAHAVLDGARTRRFLAYYFHAVNFDPELVFHASDALMTTNALWDDIIGVLQQVERRVEGEIEEAFASAVAAASGRTDLVLQTVAGRRRVRDWRTGIHLRLARAYMETGRFSQARSLLEKEKRPSARKNHLSGLLSLYQPGHTDVPAGQELLSLAYADKGTANATRSSIAGEIAVSFEEAGNFAVARQYYVSSFYVSGVPFFLPEYLWRYVCLCMAEGDYGEAAYVMRDALRIIWDGFRRLARTPIEKRLRRNRLIPWSGAFFLGCWGIGDDIIRIGMLDALLQHRSHGRFGFSVDPRMQSLYARSFPSFEFVPISRMSGPFAVSEAEYVRLRDGIPSSLDRGRVDVNVRRSARRYSEVALTEDILVAFIEAGPGLRRRNVPLLKVLPEKKEAARGWLATLPDGLNVGISWRSGQRDVMRNKSYTDLIEDWGEILSLSGVNFINLQYSWEEEELREAEKRYGCRIHMMPGVDLKNDIEDIVALSTALDVVLAPGTAVREMCAASGANVWSLSTTPVLPDLWRLTDGSERDRLFSSMIHLTTFRYHSSRGVLREVASRLAAMVSAPSSARAAVGV